MMVEKLKEAIDTLNAKKVVVSCDKNTAKIIKNDAELADKCEIIENYHIFFRQVYILEYTVR